MIRKASYSRGWEVSNEWGSSVVAISKPISEDEDIFISFKADMQSDLSIPENVAMAKVPHF